MQDQEQKLAAMDKAIRRSLADSEAGRVKFAEEIFDRLEAKYRAMVGEGGEGKRS